MKPSGPVAVVPRDVLAVIALGGALGSTGRWALSELLGHPPDRFAWATWSANVAGCLLIGVLMAALAARPPAGPRAARLLRPFLGVGVLGGFTTFSAYALDARGLVAAGRPGAALAYLLSTLLVGLFAVYVGLRAGSFLADRPRPPGPSATGGPR